MSVQETPTELWGGETTKAVANFPVSGERVPLPVVRWLGRIKGNAARVNAELGLLDAELAEKIAAAGDEIAEGVESAAIWMRLVALGCDLAQGFHLSPPLHADALLALLDAERGVPAVA